MSEIQNQHEAWKAARARLNGKSKIVELVPATSDPAADVMDIIIAAVSNALLIPATEIKKGASSPDTMSARRLAMAMCVRHPRFSADRVAEHFEVAEISVHRAVSSLDPILDSYVITRKTPLELSLPLIAKEWCAIERVQRKRPSLESILRAVCDTWNESPEDLISHRRDKQIAEARHILFGLAKALTIESLPKIGMFFGKRDHTTILHSVRKFEPVYRILKDRVSPAATPEMWAIAAMSELQRTPLAKTRYRPKRK